MLRSGWKRALEPEDERVEGRNMILKFRKGNII